MFIQTNLFVKVLKGYLWF